MKSNDLIDIIGEAADEHIRDAKSHKKSRMSRWSKWGALAACLCIVVGGVFWMQDNNSVPPVVDNNAVSTPISRGDPAESTDATQPSTPPSTPDVTGETINVYKFSSVGINAALINEMQTGLNATGWSDVVCTLLGDYSFYFKGSASNTNKALNREECIELAKAFLNDTGLGAFLEHLKIPYEFETTDADDPNLIVTYCYLTCDGERTGSYIRFVFEDNKSIGEVQAYLYASECIDTLPMLTLDEAMVNAKKVDADGNLAEVDTSEYSIKNERLVYVNGLPYYRFDGVGINIRGVIEGYALAVDITTSEISEQLTQQYLSFSDAQRMN